MFIFFKSIFSILTIYFHVQKVLPHGATSLVHFTRASMLAGACGHQNAPSCPCRKTFLGTLKADIQTGEALNPFSNCYTSGWLL